MSVRIERSFRGISQRLATHYLTNLGGARSNRGGSSATTGRRRCRSRRRRSGRR
nr:hypothetical protein [Salinigranum rubrum]